jgi:hypothetical protein
VSAVKWFTAGLDFMQVRGLDRRAAWVFVGRLAPPALSRPQGVIERWTLGVVRLNAGSIFICLRAKVSIAWILVLLVFKIHTDQRLISKAN